MADVRKTVEIALQVVGVNATTIKSVVTAFEGIKTSVDAATTSVRNFQTALKEIKAPSNLTSTVETLKQLSDLKVPKLNTLALGFEKLSKMGTPPDLSKFVTELQKLAGIKLPGITSLVSGFKKLVSLNVNNVVNKIRALNTALAELDKRGGISAFKNFARDVSRMQLAFGSAASSMNHMKKAMAETGAQADKTGFRIRSFGDKVRTVLQFRGISDAFQLVKSAITEGVGAIVEYDQALKDLQAITGATSLEVAQMGMKILEVASTTKFSASEVAQGMRTIGQAGFSASEAVETMQAVSDLATGTLSDMGTTVDLVTTAMRVFRIDASKSADIADVFANAVNRSKLTVDKLRTAMNYVGPIARDSGVSFKELAASMGTLANSGLRASTIGTGLRRVFAELIDPSKKLKAAADRAGVALSELDPRASSLSSVLSNLSLVVDDAQVAFDVFGKRGASAVLALSGTESNFQTMLETVGRSGTAAQQAAIQMEGLGVSFKNLKDKLGIFAIALGKAGIADAMKLVIDLSRDLVDALTALVGTGFGKFAVTLGIATAAVYAFSAAMVILNKVFLFTTLQAGAASAGVGIFTFALTTAKVAALAFWTSLGPVGVAAIALTAIFTQFAFSAKETATDLSIVADSYALLTKKFQDYEVQTASMVEGSNELIEANKALRKDLLDTANEMEDLAPSAKAAANSIDPLTGTILDGSEALQKYQKSLEDLRLDNLKKASLDINKVIDNQGTTFNRTINQMVTDIGNLSNIMSGSFVSTRKAAREANKFAKEIDAGNVSVREMGEYIAKLDYNNLNTQQKVIINNYNALVEQGDKFLKFLIDTGRISLTDTVEHIEAMAKASGFTGVALEAMLEKVRLLKDSDIGTFDNIMEKWEKEGVDSIENFIKEYKRLGGVFAEGEEAQIRKNALDRQGLVNSLNNLKEKQKAEKAAGVAIEKTWENYWEGVRTLEKEAYILRKEFAKNNAAHNIILLQQEQEKLAKALAENDKKHEKSEKARNKFRSKLLAEYIEKEKKLLAGMEIDTSKQEDDYKEHLEERKTTHSKHMDDIASQEAKGIITSDQANAEKLLSNIRFYEQSIREAKKYLALIDEEKDPEEYTKRNKIVLQAEGNYYDARVKALNAYNSIVTKANKKLEALDEDFLDEKKKYADKMEDTEKDRVEKLLDLEKDYADKREAINKALQEKIKDIEDDISDNRKSTISDILELETDTEEIIRNIKKKGMTEQEQNLSDQTAAYKYLKEGRILLAEAEKEMDEEKLERAKNLIKSSASLAKGLNSEEKAIDLVSKALVSQKKIRSVEGEIENQKLLTKITEETADAEAKQIKNTEAYNEKVLKATSSIQEIMDKEKERHAEEMSNLNREIEKYKEKAKIAQQRISEVGVSDSTAAEAIKAAKEELAYIEKTRVANKEKYEELSTAAKQVSIESGKIYQIIGKDGVKTFTDIVDASKELNGSFSEIQSMGTKTFKEILTKAEVDFKSFKDSLSENPLQTLTDSVEDIGAKSKAVFDVVEKTGVTAFEAIEDTTEELAENENLNNIKDTLTDIFNMEKLFQLTVEIVGYDNLLALKTTWDSIVSKTITLTTNYKTGSSSGSEEIPQYSGGGKLPGFGGGDKNPALLEDGEWIINKFAVRKFGDSFMSSINSMSLPKFKDGGRVGILTGSGNSAPSSAPETLIVRFQAGNIEAPVKITDANSRSAIKKMANELTKMRLVYAR